MIEQKRFYIRIVSPVHIGCDEVFEPLGFVVDEDACALTTFDPLDFFRNLNGNDKTKFADTCRKGNMESLLELYKFMKGRRYSGHSVELCKGFIEHYRQTLSIKATDSKRIQQELNKFSISRTSFSPHSQKPYIPGSSVKGAVRTAYLNMLAEAVNINYDHRDKKAAEILEKKLLQYESLEKDPFRLLKVSDFMPVGLVKTKIVYAINEKKKISDKPAGGPYQILEVIEPGAVFTGTITIENKHTKEAGIIHPLSQEVLFKSCEVFYIKERKREDTELKEVGLPPLKADTKDGLYLRIGRHSGAESVTIEGHRHIKISSPGKPPKHSNKATTFWLAAESSKNYQKAQLKPFGWVELGEVTDTMRADFEKREESEDIERNAERKTLAVSITTEAPPSLSLTVAPTEEVWESANLSYNAGGGGVITAANNMPGSKQKAQLRGKEKALEVTPEQYHEKLFGKHKSIPSAKVTVRKVGTNYVIIGISITKT
jgi:CRISPR-associated protein Csm5